MRPVAIVTAMPEELAPLLRASTLDGVTEIRRGARVVRCHRGRLREVPVVMFSGGDGMANAEASVEAVLRRFDVSALIGAGIAAALDGAQRDQIIAARSVCSAGGEAIACDPRLAVLAGGEAVICSVESIAATAAAKRALAMQTGAATADTESLGWARAAARAGVPFVVLRAIYDAAEEDVPEFIASSITEDGAVDRRAIVLHAIAHPRVIRNLVEMRRRVVRCSAALADATAGVVERWAGAVPERQLEHLLAGTSRTFALCIPLLPEPLRREVTIAYLLFRIADTFEDASEWPVADRVAALSEFADVLRAADAGAAHRLAQSWAGRCPPSEAIYRELLAAAGTVVEALISLDAASAAIITGHVIRSANGMAAFVRRTADGVLELEDLADLRQYCYVVAGIVGEMLTELFLRAAPRLASVAPLLRACAPAFGEALQLVNILKDSDEDARGGRRYIPRSLDRRVVFATARKDLQTATEYTLTMQQQGAAPGIVKFAALPVALARATLDRVERSGPGAKIGRPAVFRIARRIDHALARARPALDAAPMTPSGWKRSLLALLGNGS